MLLYKSEVVDKPVFSTPFQYKGISQLLYKIPNINITMRYTCHNRESIYGSHGCQKQRKLGAIRDDLQYYFGPPLAGIGLFILLT